MDEVLADFDLAAVRYHGLSEEEYKRRTPGVWGVLDLLRIDETTFWEPILGRRDFWESIPIKPWANTLLDELDSLPVEWRIVTSPANCPESYAGKISWLMRHTGIDSDRCIPTQDKYLLAQASPLTILIDDREQNLNEFKAWGGKGVLFPSLGNSLNILAANPLPSVVKETRRLLRIYSY